MRVRLEYPPPWLLGVRLAPYANVTSQIIVYGAPAKITQANLPFWTYQEFVVLGIIMLHIHLLQVR